MWWGYSPPLDLRKEINEKEDDDLKPLEVLIVGCGDARHIVKTLASGYKHQKRSILFHVIEPTLEQVARSILLLSTCLQEQLGKQEATRYFLEILGNTLLRPATAKYLIRSVAQLIDIPSESINCPWANLQHMKHKDRDSLESIFKFWERAASDGIPITDYWDKRLRKHLQTRYDYREGAYDWDYHMVLKSRTSTNVTSQEYKFWRNNGVAFTWIEGEPARCNPTLLSNIIAHGGGFIHYAYMGDITSGPFFTWALDESDNEKKLRATDVAEKEVLCSIHEMHTEEPMCEELVAAHRDPNIANCTIVTEMPETGTEQESWTSGDRLRKWKEKIAWKSIEDSQIIFHSPSALDGYSNRQEFIGKFDLLWLSYNMKNYLKALVPLAKKDAPVLVESKKYLVECRKEDLQKFTQDLKKEATENNLRLLHDFDSSKHNFARFCKN